jgi:hypothetical protein
VKQRKDEHISTTQLAVSLSTTMLHPAGGAVQPDALRDLWLEFSDCQLVVGAVLLLPVQSIELMQLQG